MVPWFCGSRHDTSKMQLYDWFLVLLTWLGTTVMATDQFLDKKPRHRFSNAHPESRIEGHVMLITINHLCSCRDASLSSHVALTPQQQVSHPYPSPSTTNTLPATAGEFSAATDARGDWVPCWRAPWWNLLNFYAPLVHFPQSDFHSWCWLGGNPPSASLTPRTLEPSLFF